MTTTGWYPEDKWVDGEDGHVHQVWLVVGPDPFGGLVADSEDQAREVCATLNRIYNRWPPRNRAPNPEPDETAVAIADALRGGWTDVDVRGNVITVTDVHGSTRKLTDGEARDIAHRWAAWREYGAAMVSRDPGWRFCAAAPLGPDDFGALLGWVSCYVEREHPRCPLAHLVASELGITDGEAEALIREAIRP